MDKGSTATVSQPGLGLCSLAAIALTVAYVWQSDRSTSSQDSGDAVPLGAANPSAWTALAPARHARSEANFVVHDGGAFHFNGFNENLGIENTVERYDLEDGTWETVAETTDSPGFPTALTHNGVVVIDGEAWLIGGRIGRHPGDVSNQVVIFDLETYAWRDGPELPVPFAGGGAAVVDKQIHVFGGLDDEARCDVETYLVYDLNSPGNGWQDHTDTSPFPLARNHFATAVLDDQIYVIGGQIGHDNCARYAQQRTQTAFVHKLDPDTHDWDRVEDLPWTQSHAEPSTFTHMGKIWSMGGVRLADRILSYDASDDEWTWHKELELPRSLLAPGARIFGGNQLVLFGGGGPHTRAPRKETWLSTLPGLPPSDDDVVSTDGTHVDTEADDSDSDELESVDEQPDSSESTSTADESTQAEEPAEEPADEETTADDVEIDDTNDAADEITLQSSESGNDSHVEVETMDDTLSVDEADADAPPPEVIVIAADGDAPVDESTDEPPREVDADTTGSNVDIVSNDDTQASRTTKSSGGGAAIWLWLFVLPGLVSQAYSNTLSLRKRIAN